MSNTFYDLQKQRRSIYSIGKNVNVSTEKLQELIKKTIAEAPSAFNSQSSRAVILFGDAHEQVWNITLETLRKIVPAEAFAATEGKINGAFKAGFGTVLFFEDQSVVEGLQKQFPLYADNFPVWSEHSTGIAQYATWLGIGATLQHYNPIIDAEVAQTWGIPSTWKLRAQMPFGSIEAEAGPKDYMNEDDRFKVFGA